MHIMREVVVGWKMMFNVAQTAQRGMPTSVSLAPPPSPGMDEDEVRKGGMTDFQSMTYKEFQEHMLRFENQGTFEHGFKDEDEWNDFVQTSWEHLAEPGHEGESDGDNDNHVARFLSRDRDKQNKFHCEKRLMEWTDDMPHGGLCTL